MADPFDIVKKYYGVSIEEYMLLSEEEQNSVREKAKKGIDIMAEFWLIPADFTWGLWQYCKQKGISAEELISNHEQYLQSLPK